MTKIEALELELAARKMVEGTGLDWQDVIRGATRKYTSKNWTLTEHRDYYELALGIVEGKPVWKGDELWWKDDGEKVNWKQYCPSWNWRNMSRNPPKPRTVMVELLMEDAEYYTGVEIDSSAYLRIARVSNACRKALESLPKQ